MVTARCNGGYDPCGPTFRYAWLAGVRWFSFRDEILFGADTVDAVFTGAPEEIFYGIETINQLIGFQLGGRGEYYLTRCLALNFGHKVGLFGNHIEHDSQIGGTAGLAMINNGPNNGRYFSVEQLQGRCVAAGRVAGGSDVSSHPPLGCRCRLSSDRSDRHGSADQSDLPRSAGYQ